MESKLEAEREQWNMHHCWGILLLYWELREGEKQRKVIFSTVSFRYPDCAQSVCAMGLHIKALRMADLLTCFVVEGEQK